MKKISFVIENYNPQGLLTKRVVVNNGEIVSDLKRGNVRITKVSNQSFKISL